MSVEKVRPRRRAATRIRAKLPARQRILQAADELFARDGFTTGINRIIAESGVAKASFYSAFTSKDALIEAYLERRHHQVLARYRTIVDGPGGAAAKVNRIFDALGAEVTEPGYRGCLFVVALAELPRDEAMPARGWVQSHKLQVRECFRGMFADAGLPDPAELAEQLVILYDGALVTAAIRPEAGAVERARAMALRIVDHAAPHASAASREG